MQSSSQVDRRDQMDRGQANIDWKTEPPPVDVPRFLTPDGGEMAAVSRSEMRELDRIAVEETGPSLAQMMENAGRSLAVLVIQSLTAPLSDTSVLVIAGTGGNGGGGACAARHLAARVGHVDVCLTEPDRLSVMTAQQLRIYRQTGSGEIALAQLGEESTYDLVVDAVLGYGLVGAPRGAAERAVRWMGDSASRVVALDLPSGLDADTGDTPGAHVSAEATLTLHMPKPGLQSPASGDLFVADLGIPAEVTRRLGIEPPVYGSAFTTPLMRR